MTHLCGSDPLHRLDRPPVIEQKRDPVVSTRRALSNNRAAPEDYRLDIDLIVWNAIRFDLYPDKDLL
jgi:hypothetical protein